jgi:hypothetical protein
MNNDTNMVLTIINIVQLIILFHQLVHAFINEYVWSLCRVLNHLTYLLRISKFTLPCFISPTPRMVMDLKFTNKRRAILDHFLIIVD